jgi:hypothetical protein
MFPVKMALKSIMKIWKYKKPDVDSNTNVCRLESVDMIKFDIQFLMTHELFLLLTANPDLDVRRTKSSSTNPRFNQINSTA